MNRPSINMLMRRNDRDPDPSEALLAVFISFAIFLGWALADKDVEQVELADRVREGTEKAKYFEEKARNAEKDALDANEAVDKVAKTAQGTGWLVARKVQQELQHSQLET